MATLTSSQTAIARTDLDRAYMNMAWGSDMMKVFALFRKEESTGDGNFKIPVRATLGGGGSADAATSYANATDLSRYAFNVPFALHYGTTIIDGKASVFITGDDNSVAKYATDQAQGAMEQCQADLIQALAGDGSGTIGTISSATNTSGSTWTIVLTQASDVRNFWKGRTLVTKASAFAGSLDAGTLLVTNVTESNLTITVTSTGNTPTATHVLGVQGTMLADTGIVTDAGFAAWLPISRPTSATSFFSVDRSIAERELSGVYKDGRSGDILSNVMDLAYSVSNTPGSKIDTFVCSTMVAAKIQKALQTQRRYEGTKTLKVRDIQEEIGFDAPTFMGPHGEIAIVAVPGFPDNAAYVLSSKSWVIAAPRRQPFLPVGTDGTPFAIDPGKDKTVAQYRSACNVGCESPGMNGVLQLA